MSGLGENVERGFRSVVGILKVSVHKELEVYFKEEIIQVKCNKPKNYLGQWMKGLTRALDLNPELDTPVNEVEVGGGTPASKLLTRVGGENGEMMLKDRKESENTY